MSPHIIPKIKSISGMTQMMGDAMGTGMTAEKMEKIAVMMDAMSTQMLRMADMMNNRSATEGEMHALHMSINDTEKGLRQIR